MYVFTCIYIYILYMYIYINIHIFKLCNYITYTCGARALCVLDVPYACGSTVEEEVGGHGP